MCIMEDEVASIWSGLGSSMGVPSQIREELEKLRIELRELKLEVAKDIAELRDVTARVAIELEEVITKHMSTMTRLEGLEARAQGLGGPSSEFNAFAYVSLDEIAPEYSYEPNSEELHSVIDTGNVGVEPVGSIVSQENEKDNTIADELVITTEDKASILGDIVLKEIKGRGGVLNNKMHLLYPKHIEVDKETKDLVKEYLAASDDISAHRIDKFRTLYHNVGDDPDEVYKRLFG